MTSSPQESHDIYVNIFDYQIQFFNGFKELSRYCTTSCLPQQLIKCVIYTTFILVHVRFYRFATVVHSQDNL